MLSLPHSATPVKRPNWAANLTAIQRRGWRVRFRPFTLDGHAVDPYLLDGPDPDALVVLIETKIGPPRRLTAPHGARRRDRSASARFAAIQRRDQ